MRKLPFDRNRSLPMFVALSSRPGLSHRAVHAVAPTSAAGVAAVADGAHAAPATMAPDVIDMDSELGYWRGHYRGLPGGSALRYGDYEPAVKLGMDAYMRSRGRDIGDMEAELEICYRRTRGSSRLEWEQARAIVRLAWNHLQWRGQAE